MRAHRELEPHEEAEYLEGLTKELDEATDTSDYLKIIGIAALSIATSLVIISETLDHIEGKQS